MFASNTSPLRRLTRVVLGTVGIFVLVQVLIRILRRAAPGPMPSRLAPLLTAPLRLRLFGSPERVLDRARVAPSMRVLERVMNLGESRIEMRISRSAWFPRDLCFPHS